MVLDVVVASSFFPQLICEKTRPIRNAVMKIVVPILIILLSSMKATIRKSSEHTEVGVYIIYPKELLKKVQVKMTGRLRLAARRKA